MVVKVYDAGEFLLKYEVQDNKVAIDYVDHNENVVPINHLWFYDPDMVDAILASMGEERATVGVLSEWFEENSDQLVLSRVDKSLLKRFLDSDNPFEAGFTYISLYSEENTYPKILRFTRSTTPTFILVGGHDTRGVKPLFEVTRYLGGGKIDTCHFTSATPEEVRVESNYSKDLWARKLNYTFKMDPSQAKFFRMTRKDGPMSPQYGLELEVSTKLSPLEIFYIVSEIEPKQEPFFIFKSDASISGRYQNNVELVTVPCSFRYMRKAWTIFFDKLERLCALKNLELKDVFDTSTDLNNGLHIHVSKESFVSGFHERKFKTVFNQWDKPTVDFLNTISGRPTSYTENSYCQSDPEYLGRTLARRLRLSRSQGRYVVHDRNTHTIEVRLFQGIVNLEHILKCLEFTDVMVSFSLDLPLSGFGLHFKQKFFEYVAKTKGYKNLKGVI